MSKTQFTNAYRSYRSMCRKTTPAEALAWIGFYSQSTRRVIERVIA